MERPAEDDEAHEGDVGRLNACLYGTRGAAKGWQQTLTKHLKDIGLTKGRGHPSACHHPSGGIKTLVHRDDYVSSGWPADLDWMEKCLEEKYQIEMQRIRDIAGEREVDILNRFVRLTPNGYEMEADPRHEQFIIEQVLGKDAELSRPVTTPGTDLQWRQQM